jgi:lysophospholipase L1-like esterase
LVRKPWPHDGVCLASSSACHAGIPALNAQLSALVANKDRRESPVRLVDQYSGFDPSTMTYDGPHPNVNGDSRMADRWYEALTPVLDGFVVGANREDSPPAP